MSRLTRIAIALVTITWSFAMVTDPSEAKKKDGKKKQKEDPYAEYVWPPPPDEARIKLEAVIAGRADVVAKSGFRRSLLNASPQAVYDKMKKPYGVAFDAVGRILVTDSGNNALLRFDREERKMDVFGIGGNWQLKLPLGLDVGSDKRIYVADATLKAVLAFDPDGKVAAVYGAKGGLENPTDAALSRDGSRLYVADSRAHQIVVFDPETAEILSTFGGRGLGEGEFNFPTSLAMDPDGNLFVVDQLNARIQQFDPEGEYLDGFGEMGMGPGQFSRPKDIAVDEVGWIYVADNAFNNVQLFDLDFALLTFVGQGGRDPGRFYGASGVAVRGEELAVVDQLGARLQVFRFLLPKDQDNQQ
ncbi:MAG: 6-bladed beta-propeller [Planctomycetota bacterium]|jgi:DNA-binding beta-propeller fold protein YncE